jgi:negative regulator of sigma E activity
MSLKVSRLLDGDLTREETLEALNSVTSDADERDRVTVYTLIGDTLRGNSTPDDGYTKRILERIKREG